MKIALVGAGCEENVEMRYVRTALEARGHSVTQISFNAEADTQMTAECLARSRAGLAGFSMVSSYRAAEFAALDRPCRELRFRGHLIARGHFAAFNAESLLRDGPAFVSVAIGEATPSPHQCDIKATLKRVDSQGIGTPRPPQSHLKARVKPPQSHPHAILLRPSSHPQTRGMQP